MANHEGIDPQPYVAEHIPLQSMQRPFPSGDVALHAARSIGIVDSLGELSTGDRAFIEKQMKISKDWDQLLSDLLPVFRAPTPVIPTIDYLDWWWQEEQTLP